MIFAVFVYFRLFCYLSFLLCFEHFARQHGAKVNTTTPMTNHSAANSNP